MKVAIAAPARKVTREEMAFALNWLHDHGFEAIYDDRLFASDHIFAGTDDFRTAVLQEYMDRPDIDVIWMARGGYSSIRIIDKLDFSGFGQHPKLFVGFSDVTVFHGKLSRLDYPTLHASMPYYLDHKTPEALLSLYDALTGKPLEYEWPSTPLNKPGSVTGVIVGGNLSVLCGMLGSNSFPETDGKILFIEEVDEYIYHVERMMYALKRAGHLAHLKALIVGGLTDIHDNPDPFGKTAEQAIFDVVKDYDYPICFDFPAGHQPDNRALFLGRNATLSISGNSVHFLQLLP